MDNEVIETVLEFNIKVQTNKGKEKIIITEIPYDVNKALLVNKIDSIRIDILEENLEEIQNIINIHKRGDRLEGENYTNGNLNREI